MTKARPARSRAPLIVLAAAFVPLGLAAQPDHWDFTTFENGGTPVRLRVVTRGLERPWSMAWLPSGEMLVTERAGRLRIVRDGRLAPEPIADLDHLAIDRFFDVAVHPDFARNGWVY